MKSPFAFVSALAVAIASVGAQVAPQSDASQSQAPMATIGAAGAPASKTGIYRNLFAELLGKSDAEIKAKIDGVWQAFFHGDPATQLLFYPVAGDMAYVPDVGSGDVRTEGMSYGMMLCVQLNHQQEFNQLWKFAKTHMYNDSGPMRGYFTWHTDFTGGHLNGGPAPDGEEWFTMALFFAAHRWGGGEGITNYEAEAQAILRTMLHKDDDPDHGTEADMFDPATKEVRFVPDNGGANYTDASYHLPSFYELWAQWAADPKDRAFMAEVVNASHQLWKNSADPMTGLMPNSSGFDGKPAVRRGGGGGFAGGPKAAPPAPVTMAILTTSLSLTEAQVAQIGPIWDEITRAQAKLTAAMADNTTARAAGITRIAAILTEDQKPLFTQFATPGGRGARGARGAGAGGGAPQPQEFREDAWRTLAYPAMDWSWWGTDPWEIEESNRVLRFLATLPPDNWPDHLQLNGTPTRTNNDAPGMHSMAAVAGLAADPALAKPFVQALWDMKIPDDSDPARDHTGDPNYAAQGLKRSHRYYDGMLYFLALLEVSGNFRIYAPPAGH